MELLLIWKRCKIKKHFKYLKCFFILFFYKSEKSAGKSSILSIFVEEELLLPPLNILSPISSIFSKILFG